MRPARGCRDGERGVTLVEMLVTVAVMGAGITAMVGGFAGAERSAAVARSQAALDAAMRTASDELRAAPYIACAGTAAGQAYSVSASGAAATAATVVRPEAPPVLRSATGPVAATATLCAATGAVTVSGACTAAAGEACDYGLQRVTVTVTGAGRSMSRDVWKGAGT